MKSVATSLILCSIALLTACGGGTAPEVSPEQAHAIEGARRIRSMEDSIFNSGSGVDTRAAHGLVDVYLAYAKTHPLDTLAPEYLFRAANVKRSLRDPQGSIALYDRIIRDYAGWRKLEDVFYLKAFVLDADLKQKGEAEKAYREVIGRYPDSPFAEDARRMMALIGLSDEEILQRFQQKADSAAAAEAKAK